MSNVRRLLSKVRPIREAAASERILLEAGKALLACQELEAAVQQLLAGMSVLHVGSLKPRTAQALLNGTSKVSVGVLFSQLRPHVKARGPWQSTIEQAIAARNRLVHGYFRRELQRAMDPATSKCFLSEAARLTQTVRAGYRMVHPVLFALGALAGGAASKTIGREPEAPNPSIERTSSSRLRLLAAAAHVKR